MADSLTEFQFEPDADLDWWLNMLDREVRFTPDDEVVFEPEPEEEA